jgi:hypothetical protein
MFFTFYLKSAGWLFAAQKLLQGDSSVFTRNWIGYC